MGASHFLMDANAKTVLDYVTLAIAIVGAVLGIFNSFIAWRQVRARLRVSPLVARINGESLRLCIRVVNLSAFPVHITSVGLVAGRRGLELGFSPEVLGGQRLPIRLEPRAAVTCFLPAGTEQHDWFKDIKSVRVATECGCIQRGKSAALRWFAQHRPAAAKPDEIDQLGNAWGGIVVSPHGPPKSMVEPAAQS